MYDFLLFVHVLAAFTLVSAIVVYSVLTVVGWRNDRPSRAAALHRIGKVALPMVIGGGVGALIFGIWLAIYVDGYELWDGWILASLALWVVATATGQMSGRDYVKAGELATRLTAEGHDEPSGELRQLTQSRHGLVLQLVSDAAVLTLLILMIYKPGA